MKLGVLPTKNLPVKSHATPFQEERRPLTIVKDNPAVQKSIYKNINDLYSSLKLKSLKEWTIEKRDTGVIVFSKYDGKHIIPKYQILISDQLEYKCSVFGQLLPKDHEIFKTFLLETTTI